MCSTTGRCIVGSFFASKKVPKIVIAVLLEINIKSNNQYGNQQQDPEELKALKELGIETDKLQNEITNTLRRVLNAMRRMSDNGTDFNTENYLFGALMHNNAENRGILMSKKMYTVADIAKITGYNRSTVTRWLDKQKIKKAHKLGFFSS